MLDSASDNEQTVINETINRHWESIGDILKTDVVSFADKLLKCLKLENKEHILKLHGNSEITDNDITKHINCYNNTKPVDGYHLMTGHILEIQTNKNEYWICLSPACDLVPRQKTSGVSGRVQNSMPFIAVKLEEIRLESAISKASSNIYIFANINNDIKAFTIHPNGSITSNPIWEQMIANNQGKFDQESKKIIIYRFGADFTLENSPAKVVAQLRYEYALNLLQRLGAVITRVGLDFSTQK